jgi:TorA maturation chaperone TorD
MNMDNHEIAPLLARRELWLLVSAAYVDPFHQRFQLLRDPNFRETAAEAASLLRKEYDESKRGAGEANPAGLSPEAVFGALDKQGEEIEAMYRQTFGLANVTQTCPSCEIEYDPKQEMVYRCQRFADVAGFYRAFGVQVANQAGERIDHITTETEFLYLLQAKQVAALEAKNQEGYEVSRDAHREFFEQHVGWWVPAFSRLLSRAVPSGFYHELADFTLELSELERVTLGLPPFMAPVIPKPSESEEACVECMGKQGAY